MEKKNIELELNSKLLENSLKSQTNINKNPKILILNILPTKIKINSINPKSRFIELDAEIIDMHPKLTSKL